jgi:hypothetical protein
VLNRTGCLSLSTSPWTGTQRRKGVSKRIGDDKLVLSCWWWISLVRPVPILGWLEERERDRYLAGHGTRDKARKTSIRRLILSEWERHIKRSPEYAFVHLITLLHPARLLERQLMILSKNVLLGSTPATANPAKRLRFLFGILSGRAVRNRGERIRWCAFRAVAGDERGGAHHAVESIGEAGGRGWSLGGSAGAWLGCQRNDVQV